MQLMVTDACSYHCTMQGIHTSFMYLFIIAAHDKPYKPIQG